MPSTASLPVAGVPSARLGLLKGQGRVTKLLPAVPSSSSVSTCSCSVAASPKPPTPPTRFPPIRNIQRHQRNRAKDAVTYEKSANSFMQTRRIPPRGPSFEDTFQGAGIKSTRLNGRLLLESPIQTYPHLANSSTQMAESVRCPPYSIPTPTPSRRQNLHHTATAADRKTHFRREFVNTDPTTGRIEPMTTRCQGAAKVDLPIDKFDTYEAYNQRTLAGPGEMRQRGGLDSTLLAKHDHDASRLHRGKQCRHRPCDTIQNALYEQTIREPSRAQPHRCRLHAHAPSSFDQESSVSRLTH